MTCSHVAHSHPLSKNPSDHSAYHRSTPGGAGIPSQHRPRGQDLPQHLTGGLEAGPLHLIRCVRAAIPLPGRWSLPPGHGVVYGLRFLFLVGGGHSLLSGHWVAYGLQFLFLVGGHSFPWGQWVFPLSGAPSGHVSRIATSSRQVSVDSDLRSVMMAFIVR